MKLSEQWLRKWVNPKATLDEMASALSLAGLEVDSITPTVADWENVLVGEVLEMHKHPNADKLNVCQINVGQSDPKTIICGAKNITQGMRVAVVLPGGKLPGNFAIHEREMRGIVSHGMVCSEIELGLAESSAGIMPLSADAPIGKALEDFLGLNDAIIDIDLTPNRGDCASVLGVAREVSVLFNTPLVQEDIVPVKPQHDKTPTVKVEAQADCPRYVTRVIQNITPNASTPLWMQERLRRSGLRSIHPVVDVTNYVMLTLGQPMHAFDANTLALPISVRRAKNSETLTLLDGNALSLTAEDCVIADEKRILALAGVMGGLDSGVSLSTTDLILESAFFTPKRVGPSARRYGLQTDSSYRFERGVDFEGQHTAIEYATALLLDIVGGEPGPVKEVCEPTHLPKTATVNLRRERIAKILGFSIADEKIETALNLLAMQYKTTSKGWEVTAPSHRFDINLEEDLIEELARIHGYDNINSIAPRADILPDAHENDGVHLRRAVSNLLVDRAYQEIVAYSFVDHKFQTALDSEVDAWRLLNPISQDMDTMRSNLWTGLLQTVQFNQNRQQANLKLFEIGRRFVPEAGKMHESVMVAGVAVGQALPEQWDSPARKVDFYDVKADCQALFDAANQSVRFEVGTHPALHPGQQAACYIDSTYVGAVGVIHPGVAQKLNIKGQPVLFEFQLDALAKIQIPHYISISKHPVVRRDLGLVVAESVACETVMNVIKTVCGEHLVDWTVFDVYRGEELGQGMKNIALGLIFQDANRTLADEEINRYVDTLVSQLGETVGAKLRDW